MLNPALFKGKRLALSCLTSPSSHFAIARGASAGTDANQSQGPSFSTRINPVTSPMVLLVPLQKRYVLPTRVV